MFARNRAARSLPEQPQRDIPLSVAQRTAAQRLQLSKQTIPHFYLQTSFDATRIAACREAALPNAPAWDAFFVAAVAKALQHFERFRCRFAGERLVPAETDAVGVAVDVNDELFVVPIGARRRQDRGADLAGDSHAPRSDCGAAIRSCGGLARR